MTFALLEHDPRYGLPAVKALSGVKFGHDALRWVDAPPGTSVGDVLRPDGTLGPHVPPLADAQAIQIKVLRGESAAAIRSGFTSAALGSPHRYGSSDSDRENIDRAAMAALSGQKDPAWTARLQCAADGDPVTLVAHTAAQVHQVSFDLHAHVEAARVRHDDLKTQVAAAPTSAAVQAITWA